MGRQKKKKQKQLARRKTKQRSPKPRKRTSTALVRDLTGKARRLSLAVKAPVHECYCGSELFERGIGTVFISRKMPNGDVGAGVFLLDVYCLGVKNAYFTILTPGRYAESIDAIDRNESLETIHHSCARKLIEECVAYARDVGFNPHKEYNVAKKIFGDIDPSVCPRKFEFGHNGKPSYFSGPNESPVQIKRILKTLKRTCGPDGYHFTIVGGPGD